MKILLWASIIPINMLFAGLIPAAAQSKDWRHEPAADPKITQISLGNTYNTPGTVVVVPIYFNPADGVQVGRLKVEVDFPSAYLKFEKVERGLAADTGVVDLSSEVTAYKNDQGEETSKLTLVESLASKESPAKRIASGLLANLTFRINEDWGPTTIKLKTFAEATEIGSAKPLQRIRIVDAKVDILVPGGIGCFFFSH